MLVATNAMGALRDQLNSVFQTDITTTEASSLPPLDAIIKSLELAMSTQSLTALKAVGWETNER